MIAPGRYLANGFHGGRGWDGMRERGGGGGRVERGLCDEEFISIMAKTSFARSVRGMFKHLMIKKTSYDTPYHIL